MNKQERKFVLINNAHRQRAWSDHVSCKVNLEDYDYSAGELGLLHPRVSSWFSLPKDRSSFSCRKKYGSDDKAFLVHITSPKDLPVLLYSPEMSPTFPFQSIAEDFILEENPGYFVAPLVQSEFAILEGDKLDEILRYAMVLQPSKIPDIRKLTTSWNHLSTFDIHVPVIHSLPIEVTQRSISREYIESQESLLRNIDAQRRTRAQSFREVAYSF